MKMVGLGPLDKEISRQQTQRAEEDSIAKFRQRIYGGNVPRGPMNIGGTCYDSLLRVTQAVPLFRY